MFKSLLSALFVLTALPAWATTTFYVGNAAEAAFNSAAGSLSYISFGGYSGLAAAPTLTETATGVIFGGFFGNNTGPDNLDVTGTRLDQVFTTTNGSTLRVDLPATGVYSFAMRLILAAGTSGNFCFEAPGTTACDYQTSVGTPQNITNSTTVFYGIVSDDAALTDFQIRRTSGSGAKLGVTEFAVGGASEAPEPSTLAMMGSALVLLPLIARRRIRLGVGR